MDQRDRLYDEWLVARSKGGSAAALDLLVRRWQPRLLRQATTLTGDLEAAWDITQDTWLAIVRGLGGLDDPIAFPAWAFRIVHNKSIEWIRKRQRRRTRDERLQQDTTFCDTARSDTGEGDNEALNQALSSLAPDQRALVDLYYFEKLGLAEIADIFGIPQGTVKSRLYHCRQELRRKLEVIAP